jgi:tape measure domain-containing protein
MREKLLELFAEVGFKLDEKSLKNFNRAVNNAEKSMQRYEKQVKKGNVETKKEIGEKKKLTTAIEQQNRVIADQVALRKKSLEQRIKENIAATRAMKDPTFSTRGRGMESRLSHLFGETPADRRRARVYNRGNAASREAYMSDLPARPRNPRTPTPRTPSGGGGGSSGGGGRGGGGFRLGAGAGAGGALAGGVMGIGRVFTPGLPGLAAGGLAVAAYGGKQIANRAQDVLASQMAFRMVEGGDKSAGNASFKSYIGRANQVGIGFQDNATNFLNLKTALKAQKMEGKAEDIFFNFAEYGSAMGASPERMQKAMMAIGQMAGKGQIMAEELKGQLAENMPGAISMFANALTGGDVAKLLSGMEAGKFKSADLAKVSDYLATQTKTISGESRYTMAREQARMTNTMDTMAMRMNNGGLNQGMSVMFNKLNEALSSLNTTLPTFAKIMGGSGTLLGDSAILAARSLDNMASSADSILKASGNWIDKHPVLKKMGSDLVDYTLSPFVGIGEMFTGVDETLATTAGKNSMMKETLGYRAYSPENISAMSKSGEIHPARALPHMIGSYLSQNDNPYVNPNMKQAKDIIQGYSRPGGSLSNMKARNEYITPNGGINIFIDGVKSDARAVIQQSSPSMSPP